MKFDNIENVKVVECGKGPCLRELCEIVFLPNGPLILCGDFYKVKEYSDTFPTHHGFRLIDDKDSGNVGNMDGFFLGGENTDSKKPIYLMSLVDRWVDKRYRFELYLSIEKTNTVHKIYDTTYLPFSYVPEFGEADRALEEYK